MQTILFNANIYTQDPSHPFAQALVIDNGFIIAAGSNDEIFRSFQSPATEALDMEMQTILPGFTDAHLHLMHLAQFLEKIDCETPTRQACLDKIREKANTSKPGEWILGHGWNSNNWQEQPNKECLDDISPDNPVYLTNKSLHGAWANSHAFKIAVISSQTPDPEDGIIGRDLHGEPDGLLYESAVNLIENILPKPTFEKTLDLLLNAQKYLLKFGITSVHDFDRKLSFSALQTLNSTDQLLLNVRKSIPVESLDKAIAIGLHTGFGNSKLQIGSIKLFMDGALGTKTAAMLEPYENSQDCGFPILSSEELLEIAMKASRNHLSMAIHAIGDRANRDIITTMEQLRQIEKNEGISSLYHRIEHVQTITAQDIKTMASLNLIASMQPIHLCSDIQAANKNWGTRNINTFAFRSFLDQNIPLIFGSDAPVETPDCIKGIHAAVNRTDGKHQPENGWYPNQKISRSEAIKAFTSNIYEIPGFQTNHGKLIPGYHADLIVLSDDIYTVPDDQILSITVRKTMIDGSWVWQE